MSNPITESIMGAWDDEASEGLEGEPQVANDAADEAEDLDDSPSDDTAEDEETPSEEEDEDAEPGEEADDEEESSDEEEEEDESGDDTTAEATFSDDPEVQAFLARQGGTVESAIKKSMQFENVLGRQGRELGDLRRQNEELVAELEQVKAFQQQASYLNSEQQEWVEEASGSGNPIAYIQTAVQAGEFALARAVIDSAELPTGQVLRLAQAVDAAERAQVAPVQAEEQVLNHQALLSVLSEHYPEMPLFESEMVSTLALLGNNHPLAHLARSNDPNEAAQGIIGIYEIARAKTATVTSARDEVKKKRRDAGDAARRGAQVTSSQASPSQEQAPRARSLMPGLTMEALEAEFDAE